MTDETHVTDPGKGSPTLDDIADVQARTNRGIQALSRQVATLGAHILLALGLLSLVLARLASVLRAVQGVS